MGKTCWDKWRFQSLPLGFQGISFAARSDQKHKSLARIIHDIHDMMWNGNEVMPFSSILLLNYPFLYFTNILLNLYLCVWYEKLLVCSAAAAADVTMETQFTGTNQNISGSSSSLNQLCRLGGWPASAEPGVVCCAILMTNPGLVICSISIQHTSTPS